MDRQSEMIDRRHIGGRAVAPAGVPLPSARR
jgi:hypothetical protein